MPTPSTSSFDSKGLIALMTVGLLQNIAYHGFYAIFILYLIAPEVGLHLTDQEIGFDYSLFRYALIVGLILGGVLVDFLLKKYRGLKLGLALLIAGYLVLLIPNETALITGLFIMALGTALSRVSMYAILSDLFANLPGKRAAGFVTLNIILNLGAATASVLILILSLSQNFTVAFSFFATLSGLSLFLSLFFLRENQNQGIPALQNLNTKTIGLPIFVSFLTFAFWSIYGIYYVDFYHQTSTSLLGIQITDIGVSAFMQGFSTWGVIFLSIIFLLALYFGRFGKAYINILLAILALAGAVLAFYALSPLSSEDQGALPGLLLVFLMAAIAEVLFVPMSIHYLTKHSSVKYQGCLIALFLVCIEVSILTGSSFDYDFHSDLRANNSTLIAGLLAVLLLIPMFFIGRHYDRKEATEAPQPPHLPE